MLFKGPFVEQSTAEAHPQQHIIQLFPIKRCILDMFSINNSWSAQQFNVLLVTFSMHDSFQRSLSNLLNSASVVPINATKDCSHYFINYAWAQPMLLNIQFMHSIVVNYSCIRHCCSSATNIPVNHTSKFCNHKKKRFTFIHCRVGEMLCNTV